MRRPHIAWGVPQELGNTPGYQIACSGCRPISWSRWPGVVPEGGLVAHGYMATACERCGVDLVCELAPDWGEHPTPYPAWLRALLGEEGEEWLIA